MQRLKGERGIAYAVTKGARGAASASRSFWHAPASEPPASGPAATALRPAVAPMQLVRCCPATTDAVAAPLPTAPPTFGAGALPGTNAAHTLVLADVGDTGCRGHWCPVKSEGLVLIVRLLRGTLLGRFYRGDNRMVGTKVSCKKSP